METTSANIQAVVPDFGQTANKKINIASDQTREFAERYGGHSNSDMIFSELSLIGMELLILWLFVLMVMELRRKFVLFSQRKKV